MAQLNQEIEKLCKFAFTFSNIDTVFINALSQLKSEFVHNQVPEPLKAYFGNIKSLLNLHETNSEHDVLFHSSSYRINFISASLFDGSEYLGSIVVGPYLLEEPTPLMIHDVLFEIKLSISVRPILEQYYLSLPLICTYKAKIIAEFLAYLSLNLHATDPRNPCIGEVTYHFHTEYPIIPEILSKKTESSIAIIEERYRREKKFLNAVEDGNREKLEQLLNEELMYLHNIPDRIPNDPLRSRKNLAFVTNTLLRKSAEKGGVHPIYIDSISEKFAIQIEKTSSIQQLSDLQNKMYLEYCDTVKMLSLKGFNRIIRKAIEFIRLNLDQNLNLGNISKAIHSSTYELSRQFKKETGQTITEYINKLRIKEALKIMENENMSITDIAQMVGFNDVNYFTKVFKKFNGFTPSEYRKGKIQK
ncbi:AraC family transcriptional regulator [Neobacillus pocheonensis]|uniref:AraC family transcriptional regulator n=1 Tax=Neobacillus pocheonensis TaxID=363869 RepID=A0ABT0WBX5_9BACI|nr:AraC family transcriptional regulator [Neobacillus pocheonensis]